MNKKRINRHKTNQNAVTKPQIIDVVKRDLEPALYIQLNGQGKLKVANGVLYTNDYQKSMSLIGATLVDVTRFLQANKYYAKITKRSYALMPACLLLDYSNTYYVCKDINISPFNLATVFPGSLDNFDYSNPSSISRNVIAVTYNNSRSNFVKGDGFLRNTFNVSDNKLLLGHLESDLKCIIEVSVNSFCLFLSKENIIDINIHTKELLQNGLGLSAIMPFVEEMNALNRDAY